MTDAADTNPLLGNQDLPPFAAIAPAHALPAVQAVLAENRAALDRIAGEAAAQSSLLVEIDRLSARLQRVWSPISHLHAVNDTEPWREAYNACLPLVTTWGTDFYQHDGLYRALSGMAQDPGFAARPVAERAVVEHALRDFRLAGIELDAAGRARMRELRTALAAAETVFGQNVLDATYGWHLKVDDPSRLRGLPESAIALARANAGRLGTDGWALTLEQPSYVAVMTHADDRALREEVYRAYVTRASDQGPRAGRWDNAEVMTRILALRRELAQLLGFENYAQYSLATKMARDPRDVLAFLRDLGRRARPAAQREFEELERFGRQEHGLEQVQAWDVNWLSEKLRQRLHSISAEALRPYFPLPTVLRGMFAIAGRLFGVRVESRQDVSTWHPDVTVHEIFDREGRARGLFYMDAHARPHKRGGAWMDDCASRWVDGERLHQPVAYLNCNFSPPSPDGPALLTHDEVSTLFHEFGHGLHHMLTLVDRAAVSGINGVAWDAVELPSQFMENWCWEPTALAMASAHHRTGEPLPQELVSRLRGARDFHAAMHMVRQIEFALFDFSLHMHADAVDHDAIRAALDAARAEVAVVRYPGYNRFANGFTHIFSGGYAAGYYSYKWAEVLAADAYDAFAGASAPDPVLGARFMHTILEQGGSREPLELFVDFRGREPTVDALLRQNGIAA
ncbi:MAG: M3 family metallopeptidase [Gammaproteobacteria bacterium]